MHRRICRRTQPYLLRFCMQRNYDQSSAPPAGAVPAAKHSRGGAMHACMPPHDGCSLPPAAERLKQHRPGVRDHRAWRAVGGASADRGFDQFDGYSCACLLTEGRSRIRAAARLGRVVRTGSARVARGEIHHVMGRRSAGAPPGRCASTWNNDGSAAGRGVHFPCNYAQRKHCPTGRPAPYTHALLVLLLPGSLRRSSAGGRSTREEYILLRTRTCQAATGSTVHVICYSSSTTPANALLKVESYTLME